MADLGISGMLTEQRDQIRRAGAGLSDAIGESLFSLTQGEMGFESQTSKISKIRQEMLQGIQGGGDELATIQDAMLKFQAIGATDDAAEAKNVFDSLSTQAEKESLQARRLAAGRESEKSLAESQRQFDLEQQRLEKAASDAAAAKVEAAEVKAATDAAKKQVALQKARPSEAKVDDNIMKLISGAEGLKDIVDDSGKIPDDVKFGEGNRDSLQLFYKEAFLAGVPEADIQDAIQKSIGYIANGDDGGWLGWAKDTLTFDIEQAKTLIAGLGTDSGIEAQLGAE